MGSLQTPWIVTTVMLAALVTLSQGYTSCPELHKQNDTVGKVGKAGHSFYVNESRVNISITFSKNVSEFKLIDVYHETLRYIRAKTHFKSYDNQTFVLLFSELLKPGNLSYKIEVVAAYHNKISLITCNNRIICEDLMACGEDSEDNNSHTSLIFGGSNVNYGQWPWLAAIYEKTLGGLNFKCGGNLVRRNVIITAAHCVKEDGYLLSENDIVVFLGKYNLKLWGDLDVSQARSVSSYTLHPEYTGTGRKDFDVAILQLASHVYYTKTVKPICLWTQGLRGSIVDKIGIVAGWGKNEDYVLTESPHWANLLVVSDDECLKSNEKFETIKSNSNFCAGYRNGSGPCHGDSGGGMFTLEVYSDGSTRWVLRGIVSRSLTFVAENYNKNCDLKNYVLLTNMSSVADWVEREVNKISEKLEINAVNLLHEECTAELKIQKKEEHCTQQLLPKYINKYEDTAAELDESNKNLKQVTIENEKLKEQSIKFLNTMYEVGLNLQLLGNYNDSLTTLKLVATGRKEYLGEEHLETLTAQSSYAEMLNQMSKFDRALEIITNVTKKLNQNTTYYLKSRQIHGEILFSIAKYDEALEIFNDTSFKWTQLHNDYLNSSYYSNSIRFKVLTLCKFNKLEEAYNIIHDLLLSDNSNDTKHVHGVILYAQGKYNESLFLHKAILKERKRILGDNHPKTLNTLYMITRSLYQLNQYNLSLEHCETLIEKSTQILGENNTFTIVVINMKAMNLYYMDKKSDTIKLLKYILQKYKDIYKQEHPSINSVRNILNQVIKEVDLE